MSGDMGYENCGHVLCSRSEAERALADVPCALDDCPFSQSAAPEEAPLTPLGKAIRDARGGKAPTSFRGYA